MLLSPGEVVRLLDNNGEFINKEGKVLFYYEFKDKQPCSETSLKDFVGITTRVAKLHIDFNTLTITKNFGWSFYSLDDRLQYDYNKDLFKSRARADLEYKRPKYENERLNCLKKPQRHIYRPKAIQH